METLQVECDTHQTPFASGGPQTTQRELAKAQDVFDNAQHWFYCTFAQAVDRAANLGLEFVRHLHLWTGIGWRWRGLLRKIRLPTGMMGYTPRSDVRLNVTRFHGRDVGGAEVPIVQGASLGCAQGPWDGVQGWEGLGLIVGMVGQGVGHNQETLLFHGGLGIVMLIKAIVVAVFHDARLGVSEIVLVLVSWARGRWRGGTTTGVAASLAGFGFALAYFGVVGSLLGFIAFLGPGFSDGFCLGQVGQPLLAKGDFIGDDQPLGHLHLLGVLGEGE